MRPGGSPIEQTARPTATRAAGGRGHVCRAPTERWRTGSTSRRWCSISTSVEVFYGAFRAVARRQHADPQERDHGVHRPVGLRQDHRAALLQPHARRDRRARGSPAGLRYHGAELYGPNVSATEVRRRIGMVFQKPNPFPKSIYDNVAFGPRINGVTIEGRARRDRREVAAQRGAVGRGQGPAEGLRARHVGRPAAAAVHRPHDRGRARGRADGRAVQRARSDRDRAHRGADARAEEQLHDRDRHPQHAAGRARQRPHRVLHRPSSTPSPTGAPARSSSTTAPRRSSPTRSDERTENYITGRFG